MPNIWNSDPDRITAALEGWNLEPVFNVIGLSVRNADSAIFQVVLVGGNGLSAVVQGS
jgi:hypothetical protein